MFLLFNLIRCHVKLTIYYILHKFFNLTNTMMLFIGSSCLFLTTILLINRRLHIAILVFSIVLFPFVFLALKTYFYLTCARNENSYWHWPYVVLCVHHDSHVCKYVFIMIMNSMCFMLYEFHKFIRFVIRICKNICNNEKKWFMKCSCQIKD
jgi:hypothetical protein